MSNNLDAPNIIKYAKWMKWTLNRINYYYTTLIYTIYLLTLSISQSSIIIWYYDNLALYDDRTLVIRITMYECIFVMLTEFRTGGGA